MNVVVRMISRNSSIRYRSVDVSTIVVSVPDRSDAEMLSTFIAHRTKAGDLLVATTALCWAAG